MAQEQKLNIQQKVVNGKTYNNLNLRELANGNYVIVTKNRYAAGRPVTKAFRPGEAEKTSYSCLALYGGQEVSFFLPEDAHAQYEAAGGVGDNVKITFTKEIFTFTTADGKSKDTVKHKYTIERA